MSFWHSARLSRDGALLVFIDGVGPAGPAVRMHLASGERRRSIAYFVDQSTTGELSPSGRFLMWGYFVAFEYGSQVNLQCPSDSVAFDVAEPWAKELEVKTKGRVKVEIHNATSPLGKIFEQANQVRAGTVDIALGLRGA